MTSQIFKEPKNIFVKTLGSSALVSRYYCYINTEIHTSEVHDISYLWVINNFLKKFFFLKKKVDVIYVNEFASCTFW